MFTVNLAARQTRLNFTKTKIIFCFAAALAISNALTSYANAEAIKKFPILERLQGQGKPLSAETLKWMGRWRGVDLEDRSFLLDELSGTTSVYVKVRKPDLNSDDGYKAYGTFASRNASSNPYSEIAYFNLAAILGYDTIFRPVVRYSLGASASQEFKSLLENSVFPESYRTKNKNRILNEIATGQPLKGCLKAKKQISYIAYDAIANINAPPNGLPQKTNPIIFALQAPNPQPIVGRKLALVSGYSGNMIQLAREYSVIMTLDVIFQQWDRYSGNNVVIAKNSAGVAHFYSTDNGGADLENYNVALLRSLKSFSRYDRNTIKQLKTLYGFLVTPAKGFLGYKNAEAFVVDLGLYGGLKPAEYVTLLKRNLRMLLERVTAIERQYGSKAYLP